MTHVNWRRPAALAAGLFILGSFAVWLEYGHKPKKEAQEEQSKRFMNLKDVSIATFTIHGNGMTYSFKCADPEGKLCKPGDAAKWDLTTPMKVRADDSNVNILVSAISNLNYNDTIDLSSDTPEKRAALLKEYKLDKAFRESIEAKRIDVTTQKGEHIVAYIGDLHPIGESLFALRDSDENKVYLIPNYFKANFEHPLDQWRDKKLLTIASHEIDSFELKDTKKTIKASRAGAQWTISDGSKNGELAGDMELIDNVLSAITYLNAKSFVAENKKAPAALKALQGASTVLTVKLQPSKKAGEKESPAPIVMTMLEKKKPGKKPETTLYATISSIDPLVEIETSAKGRINKELKDLRLSKLITSMERFTAKKLELTGKDMGATPVILSNEDSKWLLQPDKKEAKADKVQTFLDKLSTAKIKEFLTGSAIPKGQETGITLTLSDEKAESKRKIVYWKNGDKVYARDLLSKRNEAFLMDGDLKDSLPWSRDFFL
jgi:hypothetical protein